ncbi:uncharacterized protein [Acropora muricata]|uniref:uncharacterized protein n=1 Tax=Acropora muricata TaxID=159855 RepID=UPI0034E520BD
MGDFQRFPSVFSFIVVCAVAIIRLTDGSSITWFEPPPFEIVTDPATVSEVNKSLIKGSLNEEVNCNFSLTADLSLITVSMKFEGSSIVNYVRLQDQHVVSVQPGFERRFNATWDPNRLTLILFNVTSADEGEYRCEVLALGSSGQTWARIIQVSLLDIESPRVSITSTSAPEKVSPRVSTTPTSAPEAESSSVSTTPTSAPETERPSAFTTHTSAPAVSGTTTRVHYGQARELIFVIVLVSLLDSLL